MPYLSSSTVEINTIGLQAGWLACIHFRSFTRLPHVQRSSMALKSTGVCNISCTRSCEIRKRSACKAKLVQTQSLASPDHSVQAQEGSECIRGAFPQRDEFGELCTLSLQACFACYAFLLRLWTLVIVPILWLVFAAWQVLFTLTTCDSHESSPSISRSAREACQCLAMRVVIM